MKQLLTWSHGQQHFVCGVGSQWQELGKPMWIWLHSQGKNRVAHNGNAQGTSENAWGTGVTTLLVHLISPLQLQSESATCLAPNHVPATPDTCPHTCHLQASPQRTQLWLVHTRNFGIVCTVLLTYCHSKSEAVICSGGGNNKCALCGSTYSMAKAWHPPLFAIGPPPTIHTRGENAVNYITTRVLLPP